MAVQYTNQIFELAQDIIAGSTYATLDFTSVSTPVVSATFVLKVGSGEVIEWFVCNGMTSLGSNTYRTTVLARGLDKDAQTIADVSTSNQKTFNITTQCKVVTHSYDWVLKMSKNGNNTVTSDNTWTGTNTVSNTTSAGIIPQSVTTAERDALTGVVDGAMITNSTTGTTQVYEAGAWEDVPTGSTNPNATESIQGKMQLSSVANQLAGADGTLTTPAVVIQSRYLKKTASSTQTDDASRITVLDSNGDINRDFLNEKSAKFGGTGVDGVLAGSVSITGDDQYIVRNYRSITAGAFTLTITGTNSIIHLKVKGNADLTGWTINAKGKGAQPVVQNGTLSPGGVVTSSTAQNGIAGGAGVNGNATCARLGSVATQTSGGQTATGGSAGTAATSYGFDISYGIPTRTIVAACGQAGGGGAGGFNITVASGAVPPYVAYGGQGGAGGGCIILEVLGNLTFSSTSVDVSGNNGSAGSAGSGSGATGYCASGGGGGGAGGTFVYIYGGTLSGSPTVTATGGSGGAAGATGATGGGAGGGGAGGSNIYTAGSNGSAGNATGVAGAGGAGAAGTSLGIANTLFS